jgi:hypothetical protein
MDELLHRVYPSDPENNFNIPIHFRFLRCERTPYLIWIEEYIPVILRYKTARKAYLQVWCRENGIKRYSKMKRKEMIQALMKI